MTYFQFLLIFLILPIFSFLIMARGYPRANRSVFINAIGVLTVLAILYTTPWDNYLVMKKVWWYGLDRVMGTIGYVPVEEYAFFVLQTLFTGLWCFILHQHIPINWSPVKTKLTWWMVGLFALLTLMGGIFLLSESFFYLGLILAWASPILLIQWYFGGPYLKSNLKLFFLTVLPPTIYLWVADAYAIHWGIWEISKKFTTGVKLVNLPMEEAVFFLVTNLMVGQGLILFVAMRREIEKFGVLKRIFYGNN